MTLRPQRRITRFVALGWLLACVTFLLLTLLQHELHTDQRSALAMLVPVYFLAFPSGHIALVIIGKIKLALYLNGAPDPDVLTEALFLWALTVVLGYVQWFVLLPWLSRRCWQGCVTLFNRDGTLPQARESKSPADK